MGNTDSPQQDAFDFPAPRTLMPLALIAHVAFWILIVIATVQVGWRSALLFLGLWVIGYVGSGWLGPVGSFLFGSYVALLDVVLLFVLKLDS